MSCQNKIGVIILGDCHFNTLGIIRSLGETGYAPIILIERFLGNTIDYVGGSKYITKKIYIQNHSEAVYILLQHNNDWGKHHYAIITASDSFAMEVDINYEELSKYYYCASAGGKGGTIAHLMGKETMRIVAESAGFHTPQSWVIDTAKDWRIPSGIEYPCLIKASDSHQGRKDFGCYHNREQLRDGINLLMGESPVIQIQQFINKDFELLLDGVAMGSDFCITCAIKKQRQYPWEIGGFAFGETLPNYEAFIDRKILSKFISDIDYRGIFSIEFLVKDNVPYFIEINLRNDATSYLSTKLGGNVPDIWVKSMIRGHLVVNGDLIQKKRYIGNALRDFENVRNKNLSLSKWIIDCFKSKADSFLSMSDPAPCLKYFKSIPRNRLKLNYKGINFTNEKGNHTGK